MATETTWRIAIRTEHPEAVRELLRRHPLDLACGPPRASADGAVVLEALVPSGELDALRDGPWQVEVIEDATAMGAKRQREVGRGNRFAGRAVPRGLGSKE